MGYSKIKEKSTYFYFITYFGLDLYLFFSTFFPIYLSKNCESAFTPYTLGN